MITVVGNLKGGTGKSTVTFNLAVWLAYANQRLQLIDLDPQQTFSDVLLVRQEERYQPELPLAGDAQVLTSIAITTAQETLIDVSVADKTAMFSAIAQADRIIIPCAPSQADVWSTQKFTTMIHEQLGNKPIYAFINRADTHHRVGETQETETALSQLHGVTLLPVRLYQRTAYRRSFSEGLAVFELDAHNKAAQEVQALATLLYPHYQYL